MPRRLYGTPKRRIPPAPSHNTRTLPLDEGRTLHVCLSDDCSYRAVVDWSTNPYTTTEIGGGPKNVWHRLLKGVQS